MGFTDIFAQKKSMAEIEEEKEYTDAKISLLERKVILKELKKRDIELSQFRSPGESEQNALKRAYNWLKTH